jgi:hypothetical protein
VVLARNKQGQGAYPLNRSAGSSAGNARKREDQKDFISHPFRGEPTRVAHLLKYLLLEANTLRVIQEVEGGGEEALLGADCFLKDEFYFIETRVPQQPLHVAGEDEQARRDVEALISNWKYSTARMTARNQSHRAFWDHFSLEETGWLRRRIAPEYWLSLAATLPSMEPRPLYKEFVRIGAITGEINSTIADNQRFQAALAPWKDSNMEAHEFLSRFMQLSRDDAAIPLSDGTVFDPLEEANWSEVQREYAHRLFYRLITQHSVFDGFKLPLKYHAALAKYFDSPVEHRLYSQKNAALITEFAKLDTTDQIWDGAPKIHNGVGNGNQLLKRAVTSPAPGTPAAEPIRSANRPSIPASVRRLVRDQYLLTNKALDALGASEQQVLVVGALRQQLASPVPSPPHPSGQATQCNCGAQPTSADCRDCCQQLLARWMQTNPPRGPITRAAPAAIQPSVSPGLTPNLTQIAQAAVARQAAATGPAANTRGYAKKIAMIRLVRTTEEPVTCNGPPFVVDSGSDMTGIGPAEMLRWKPHTQVEFTKQVPQAQSCSGEPLTLLGDGVTVTRWPRTTAIMQLTQPVLSVKEFTSPRVDQDVFFPAQSRGLPFGVLFADAQSGKVCDVGDAEYMVYPDDVPHHQRGAISWKFTPLLEEVSNKSASQVRRVEASEMVDMEAGLAIYDAIENGFADDDLEEHFDDGAGDWLSLHHFEDKSSISVGKEDPV